MVERNGMDEVYEGIVKEMREVASSSTAIVEMLQQVIDTYGMERVVAE